jgi:hypothetical protein
VHFEHERAELPKIFISELVVSSFDSAFQDEVAAMVGQVSAADVDRFDFCASGRPWKVTMATYERMRQQSEYGAWIAAFGYRPNHFSVSVNA